MVGLSIAYRLLLVALTCILVGCARKEPAVGLGTKSFAFPSDEELVAAIRDIPQFGDPEMLGLETLAEIPSYWEEYRLRENALGLIRKILQSQDVPVAAIESWNPAFWSYEVLLVVKREGFGLGVVVHSMILDEKRTDDAASVAIEPQDLDEIRRLISDGSFDHQLHRFGSGGSTSFVTIWHEGSRSIFVGEFLGRKYPEDQTTSLDWLFERMSAAIRKE